MHLRPLMKVMAVLMMMWKALNHIRLTTGTWKKSCSLQWAHLAKLRCTASGISFPHTCVIKPPAVAL
jgi:hypothetical protein